MVTLSPSSGDSVPSQYLFQRSCLLYQPGVCIIPLRHPGDTIILWTKPLARWFPGVIEVGISLIILVSIR